MPIDRSSLRSSIKPKYSKEEYELVVPQFRERVGNIENLSPLKEHIETLLNQRIENKINEMLQNKTIKSDQSEYLKIISLIN